MILNGSEILVNVLLEQGVDTVFGYPGGAVLNIYDALYKYSDKIHHTMTAHEQGAAHAADGYARSTGKTGVVIATSGPGATNLVTGIATAYMDSVPLVAITGNVSTPLIGCDSFQEVYIAGITMPITKHNFVVRKVEDLADTVREAFRIAASGRPGPVLIDIPKDVTANKTTYVPMPAVEIPAKDKIVGDIEEIADLINRSERPFIYFGGGVRISEASDELRALINTADIPAAYTLMAAGVLGYGEKNNLGLMGMHGCYSANCAANRADVMIAIGTRFSDRVALNTEKFGHNAKIVHIDIDPGEIGKNVTADYSIVGDVKRVLTELMKHIKPAKHDAWSAQISEWKKDDYVPTDSDTELKPHYVIGKACEIAGEDAIYVTDVGQHQMWAAQFIHHVHPKNFLTSGGLGTMGYGYGAALGAQTAHPDKPVIHFTSDGSFHMNMNEVCTAVSYKLPVITVILNNAVLGMVRQWQGVFYGRRFASSEPERVTDYVKVVEGFGGKGFHCETPAEFEAAMREAVKSCGPVWIECVIDREEKVLPMIPAGGTVHDTIFK
ncbi:MAG: biosynthetic-type acetolactate synthase large subunit [Ruminococcaceae bacterium]|nr:biosynthetic-type acetolactate synthase large subunit [Oscillospiraceae bacterium]